MSRQLINEYRAELDRLRQVSGSRRESVLRDPFKVLLQRWGRTHDLQFVPEHDIVTPRGNRIYVDGALLHGLRVPFGYWEAKDEDDKLDAEIEDKFRKGYPRDNILFTDDRTAVLYQDGHHAGDAAMDDTEALLALVTRFFAHERQEVADFRKAVKQFAADLPAVLAALRDIIAEKRAASSVFAAAEAAFLAHAQGAINPAVSDDDVTEMLIQHILTEDIFAKVFENPDFHRQNNIAAELYKLEGELFGPGERAKLLHALRPYYAGIQSTAALISSHSEKQGFLKALYENFYKVYNPMASDRLGVVYTPGEIVRFMIRSADWLCEKHFGKNLVDRGVEILDPATGTGTFIVELLEHFRGDHAKLRHKYKQELHANEVAILPYYVANLNIEATYAAITGQFAEFENLCFVDTLDNVAALGKYSGYQDDMFGGTSDENMGRIKRQNERKISVIIGNPPYNANQQNENDNNKNREYRRIDERIKQTYIKASTAQKTKLYDMYIRFFRWASDRLGEDGVVAFITNRSFIDAHTADGFRRVVGNEFAEGWVVDLGGDYKKNGVGGTGNVFEIGTGVAVSFWVKRKSHAGEMKLFYVASPSGTGDDKRSWIAERSMGDEGWRQIGYRDDAAWIDLPEISSFSSYLPMASVSAKRRVSTQNAEAIFSVFAGGIKTNRGEWVYDRDPKNLVAKTRFFASIFDAHHRIKGLPAAPFDLRIKWSRDLKRKRALITQKSPSLVRVEHRPFSRLWFHANHVMADVYTTLHDSLYGEGIMDENPTIPFLGRYSSNKLAVLATKTPCDYDFLKMGNGGTETVSRYRHTKSGERVDNITDWAVAQFRGAYGQPLPFRGGKEPHSGGGVGHVHADAGRANVDSPHPPTPSPEGEGEKDAIFAYCYAVLHDPVYRETYALNLKREFPRIPFYPDFARWVAWGEQLLALHIGYEDVSPHPLTRTDTPNPKRAEGTHPKPKLKSVPDTGAVVIDEDTQLSGIPRAAWDYRLGNRSAIDWVLDQHKEKTPRDPTVRAKFNTYRFADYKESMIALLAKVVTVSIETVKITEAMRAARRDEIAPSAKASAPA